MRPSLALALAIAACLLITGFRLDGLPFIPSAQFSDAAVSHYPAALTIYRTGAGTSWTELNMAGQPFEANPLNKTAYPLQFLARILPPPYSLNVLFLVHFVLAGFAMYSWARVLALSRTAAMIAGIAYALSPRLLGHTAAGHLDLLYAMAAFPLVMACVHLYMREGTRRTFLALALITAVLIVADLRLGLFAVVIAAAYGLYRAAQGGYWRRALVGVGAAAWAGVLSLGVFIPLLLWQPYISRATLTSAEAGAFSLAPGILIGLLLAPPAIDIESQTFVGIAVLVLAAIGILSAPRQHLFWIVALVVATLYALGSNGLLWSVLVEVLPPLRWFRVPARAWFVVALIMPLLAGYGVEALINANGVLRRRLRPFLVLTGAVAVICGVFILFTIPQLAQSGLRLLLIGGGTALVIAWTLKRRGDTHIAQIAVFTLVLLDLGWNARLWLEWRGREAWMTPYVALAERLRAEDADRIYSPAYSLPQQVAAEYDLHLFGGVDPFQLRAIADAIESASGVGHHGYTVTQPPLIGGEGDDLSTANRDAIPDTTALAAWQVSHVVAPYPIEHSRLELHSEIDGVWIYRNLDYRLTLPREQVPRWAQAEGLPDAETVARNNRITSLTQGLATLALTLTAVATIYFYRREKSSTT
jgi:hypothetical protein